jgi:hypothetical protein
VALAAELDAQLEATGAPPGYLPHLPARLTEAGRAKLLEATPPLDALHRRQFRRFSPEQMKALRSLVALIADPADVED